MFLLNNKTLQNLITLTERIKKVGDALENDRLQAQEKIGYL